MAAETPEKLQSPQKPAVALPATALPQKPATKTAWITGEGDPLPDSIKVPDHRPNVLVYIKTQAGYVKALEIDRDGDSLFGTGQVARDFSEILSDAISRKISVSCESGADTAQASVDSANIRYIRDLAEERKKIDEFATLLLSLAIAGVFLCSIAYFVIGRIRSR